MNSVHLIGRLTRDPDATDVATGATVATMRVAVDRPGEGTDFVTVTAWDRLAEVASTYLTRGRRVALVGRLRHHEWTDDTGKRDEDLTVVADRIEFLDPSPAQTSQPETAPADDQPPPAA